MKTILKSALIIFSMVFSSCIPIELFHNDTYAVSGVLQNYITHQYIKDATVIAEYSNQGQVIKFCGNQMKTDVTDENGGFDLDFEGGCGYSLKIDFSSNKEYDKFSKYQLIVNDKASHSEIVRDINAYNVVVQIQPYISLDLRYKDVSHLELKEIRVPEFNIKIDSFEYRTNENIYLSKFIGILDVIAYYENSDPKLIKIPYNYFEKPLIILEVDK